MHVLSAAQLISFIVELEEGDEGRSQALESGWSLFTAARAAGLVGQTDIDGLARVVQELIEHGLLAFRTVMGGVIPPAAGDSWDGNWLQQHFGFHSTEAGRRDAAAYREREDRRRSRGERVVEAPGAEQNEVQPEPLAFWFEQLHYVFDLPAPADFPFLGQSVGTETARIFRRYVTASRELADSSALTGRGHGYRVEFDPSGIRKVEADLPTKESQRSMAVLFRQLYAAEEKASFQVTMGRLRAHVEGHTDEQTDQRREVLTQWAQAQAKLRQRWLEALIIERGQELDLVPAALRSPNSEISPEQVLSIYLYGEHIHWDRGAEQVEAWSEDPYDDARYRLLFLRAMGQLSALYIAFGALVVSAAPFDEIFDAD